MSGDLTTKQQAFVEEYLVDLNAAAAARRAGYSESTARSIGHENLRKPHIQAAVQQAMDARSRETGITAKRVLEELARVAFADPRSLMSWDEEGVRFIPSEQLTEEEAAAIQSVKSKRRSRTDDDGVEITTVELELKTHDKLTALKKLGEHLGLFHQEDQVRINILQVLAELPPEELHELEQMNDEQAEEVVVRLLKAGHAGG